MRAARSTPVNVPWTVRTRSSARNRSNGIQLARAHSSGRLSRHPSSWPLTNAGLAEMPTTSACLARRMAVRTPLSPSPAMTMRLVTPFRLPYPGVTLRATMTHSPRRLATAALAVAALAAAPMAMVIVLSLAISSACLPGETGATNGCAPFCVPGKALDVQTGLCVPVPAPRRVAFWSKAWRLPRVFDRHQLESEHGHAVTAGGSPAAHVRDQVCYARAQGQGQDDLQAAHLVWVSLAEIRMTGSSTACGAQAVGGSAKCSRSPGSARRIPRCCSTRRRPRGCQRAQLLSFRSLSSSSNS